MTLIQNKNNALNSIPRKISNFKAVDQSGETNNMKMILNFRSIKGYKDPSNFATEAFHLSLREIDAYKGVSTISQAIVNKTLTESEWSSFKTGHSFVGIQEDCCLFIPLSGNKKKFLCYYSDKSDKDSCQHITSNWVSNINSFAGKIKLEDDYPTMKASKDNLNCSSFNKKYLVGRRLEEIFKFQKKICQELSLLVADWTDSYCEKDVSDELSQEKKLISKEDSDIETAIDECINKGAIKVEIDSTASFLQFKTFLNKN